MTRYLKYLISCVNLLFTKKYMKVYLIFMSFISILFLSFHVINKIKMIHSNF